MEDKKRRLFHFSITLILIVIGVVSFIVMTKSRPQLQRKETPQMFPYVKTMTVKTESRAINILGEGTVKPVRQINLVPQVGGKVIYTSPSLVNGGEFKEGEVLLRIDPSDYQLAMALAEAKVKASESDLMIAEEEAASAKREWELYNSGGDDMDKQPPPLVVKEPQLRAARAVLEANRAELEIARLNLERTELKAPFNGRVSSENVDAGQYVTPGQPLATLYSTEAAEIVVPLENEKLFWLDIPHFTTRGEKGSPGIVRSSIAGREKVWSGVVTRTEGKIDERTRMINVVVRVDKPYDEIPPLAYGLFVTVEIRGRVLENAISIPRSALRQDDILWTVDENNKISFKKVNVILIQDDEVLIEGGLKDGDMIVTSPLKAVTDGMSVRVKFDNKENRQ